MNTGAKMIYFGQEIGERATEAEGYSGMDGRTTIFDYWSLEKVRRLYNRGACDGRLSDDEQVLLEQYRSVLSLVNSEDAIRDGAFFDLMYVNYNNPGFNPHRQYAYLRSGTDATILIVVNFSDEKANVEVNIPRHAFDVLGIKPRTVRATELLSRQRHTITFSPDTPVSCSLHAHGAVVLRIPHSKAKKGGDGTDLYDKNA